MSNKSIENTEQVRDLEKAVLGGLMLETERYDNVSLIIASSDFEGQDHQNIFQSMGELVHSNKPLDPLTVSGRLDSKNLLTRAGGKNYLIDLASSSPSAANLEAYAEMIRQKSISRKLMKINSEISELIINPQGKDAESLLDEAETKIFSLNDEASRTSSNIQKLDELRAESIEKNTPILIEVDVTTLGEWILKNEENPNGKKINYHAGPTPSVSLDDENVIINNTTSDPVHVISKMNDVDIQSLTRSILDRFRDEIK